MGSASPDWPIWVGRTSPKVGHPLTGWFGVAEPTSGQTRDEDIICSITKIKMNKKIKWLVELTTNVWFPSFVHLRTINEQPSSLNYYLF
jgi:hypothetical protein